jgi:hypothetical protein
LALRSEGAVATFEEADGAVGVEADDKKVAEAFGLLKIPDMTVVEEVETSVGGYNPTTTATGGGSPKSDLPERQQLGGRGLRHVFFGLDSPPGFAMMIAVRMTQPQHGVNGESGIHEAAGCGFLDWK